jgi:hypothetical protein
LEASALVIRIAKDADISSGFEERLNETRIAGVEALIKKYNILKKMKKPHLIINPLQHKQKRDASALKYTS